MKPRTPDGLFLNRTMVITGGASGIGLAVGLRFAAAGAAVALLDTDHKALNECQSRFPAGTPLLTIPCDVTCSEQCAAAIDRVAVEFGGIDILFNNAGITQRSAFVDTKLSVFQTVMAVNFFGSLHCTQAALPSLIERKGMIVVNESIAGIAPLIGRTGYSASKHALHGLFTSLRTELRPHGVHVLTVCPGFVKTNLQTRALGADGRITRHAQSKVGKQETPERTAEAIFKGVVKRKRMLVLTPVGKISWWLNRLAPAIYERIMARQLKSELE